jgi:hypothetical protein
LALRANGLARSPGWPILVAAAYLAASHERHVSIYALVWIAYVPGLVAATGAGRALERLWERPSGPATHAVAVVLIGIPLALFLSQRPWRLTVPGTTPDGAPAPYPVGPVGYLAVWDLAMLRLDVVLVASLAGLAQSAVYAAATRFLSLGLLASGAISQAAQPQLGEALALQDRRGAQELYQTATAWLIVPAWPVYVLLLLFSPTIMRLFGPGYEKGSTVVVVLAATMLVASACGMVSMVLTMAGRASWNMYNVLLGVAVQVGLDVWLIPRIGLVGAAIGWASGILVTNLVPLAHLFALHRLHPFGRNSVTAMGLALAAVGVPAAVARLAFGQTVTALVVAFSAAALLYPAALWVTRDRTGLGLLLSAARGRSRRPSPQAG